VKEDLKKAEIVLGVGVAAVGLIRGVVAQSPPLKSSFGALGRFDACLRAERDIPHAKFKHTEGARPLDLEPKTICTRMEHNSARAYSL